MAWGRAFSEERAASEAAELAAERAAARTRMTPYEQQLLDVLTGIRDAITALTNTEDQHTP